MTVTLRAPLEWRCDLIAACTFLLGVVVMPIAAFPEYRGAEDFNGQQDTVTVEGQVVVVGNEPFTRQRVIEKGGGGYLLSFEGDETIKLRQTGPTEVRVTGVPYKDSWQGQEIRHLRVVRWEYTETSER